MPFGGLLSAGIGGVTSIVGGLIGGSAASKAAKAQSAANQAAANQVNQAVGTAANLGYAGIAQSNSAINNGINTGTNAINSGVNLANQEIASAGQGQAAVYGDMTSGLQPYQAAGVQGLNKLASTAGTFNFDSTNLQNDPGYQFQLQQGMKALSNQGSAAGLLNSGSTLKAMANYSQGLAGTSYQNAYNRALTTYNTNQQGYQTLANLGTNANSQQIQAGGIYGSQIGQMAGLQSGTNMQGASLLNNTAMQGAGLLSNTAMQGNQWIGNQTMNGAQLAGNFTVGAGNAQAAGAVGQANAWNNALGGVGNAAMGYGMMQSLQNPATAYGGQSLASWDPGSYYNSPPVSTANMPNPFPTGIPVSTGSLNIPGMSSGVTAP
jgi:hypothetical protein